MREGSIDLEKSEGVGKETEEVASTSASASEIMMSYGASVRDVKDLGQVCVSSS